MKESARVRERGNSRVGGFEGCGGRGVTLKGLKKVKCLSQGVRTVCLCVPGWICPLVFVGLESRTAWGCCLSARLIGKYSSLLPPALSDTKKVTHAERILIFT